MMSAEWSKIETKIAALMAKAARTDNDAERAAFNAKAQELALKYAIDMATLGERANDTAVVVVTITQYGPAVSLKPKAGLWAWCGKTLGVAMTMGPSFPTTLMGVKTHHRDFTLYGRASSIEALRGIVTALCLQMDSGWLLAKEDGEVMAAWMTGFAEAASSKFHQVHGRAVADLPGTGLVLIDDYARARQAMPPTGRGTRLARASAAGLAAGRRADVGAARMGSTRALGR